MPCAVLCRAVFVVQMNASDVEAELQRALQLQSSTAAALKEAVQDKLKAEADLKAVMVSDCY
jgi:cell division protein FtsX